MYISKFSREAGFSLSEVLASMAIISITLFALFNSQLFSLQVSKSAFEETSAVLLLKSVCSHLNGRMIIDDETISFWKNQIETILPKGKLHYQDHELIITWYDRLTHKITNLSCELN
ncbi:MAG: prepilin-type N-terminal cleavage/methylation domain-containing protein [Gammaproteobacteria bacterium]